MFQSFFLSFNASFTKPFTRDCQAGHFFFHSYSPQPLLDLEGPVDFGCVVRNCKVLSKEITLYNHGTLPGNFTISYSGEKPVTIKPTKGTLKPHTAQNVKVSKLMPACYPVHSPCSMALFNSCRNSLTKIVDTIKINIK